MKFRSIILALVALASTATAQTDAVIVASADSTAAGCRFTTTQTHLMSTGLFNSVDIIDARAATPTLAQLQAYDAAICWTNYSPADYNAWGDVMADYVDAGGGVVVTVYGNSSTGTGHHLGGRWVTGGYEVIVSQSGSTTGNATLGLVLDPAHPVMAGVVTFDGGTFSTRPIGTALTAGSTLIAEWSDGKVLVAEGASPQRLDLGMYPPSASCYANGWIESTDGAILMGNALAYVAGGGGPGGTPFCFGDGTGAVLCPCGNDSATPGEGCLNGNGVGAYLEATGSASVGGDTLQLAVHQAHPSEFGIYVQNISQSAAPTPFYNGLFCLAGDSHLVRHYDPPTVQPTVTNTNGYGVNAQALTLGDFLGDTQPGVTMYYQFWGRDTASCGNGANFSSGLAVVWGP